MSLNGHVPLSAIDLLGLAERRKVARVDLAEAGYEGVVYVCDLTAAQQQKIVAAARKDVRIRENKKENWTEYALADLINDASATKFIESCLVTDKEGGAVLERAFEAAMVDDEAAEYIVFPSSELILMFDLLAAELKAPHKAREKLDSLPNTVTDLISKTVRKLSGLAGDVVEEKKDNS
jgi:hypothetical protein